jgi:hypothetical protein
MAKRALTAEELYELDQLRQRSIVIWNFMSRKDELVRTLAPAAKEAVEEAYRKRDLRAMRAAYRDDSEWMGSLPQVDQQRLKSMIAALGQGGPGMRQIDETDVIPRIVSRGKIRSDDEYRVVMTRVEEIHLNPAAVEELRRLNELLSEFDFAS